MHHAFWSELGLSTHESTNHSGRWCWPSGWGPLWGASTSWMDQIGRTCTYIWGNRPETDIAHTSVLLFWSCSGAGNYSTAHQRSLLPLFRPSTLTRRRAYFWPCLNPRAALPAHRSQTSRRRADYTPRTCAGKMKLASWINEGRILFHAHTRDAWPDCHRSCWGFPWCLTGYPCWCRARTCCWWNTKLMLQYETCTGFPNSWSRCYLSWKDPLHHFFSGQSPLRFLLTF